MKEKFRILDTSWRTVYENGESSESTHRYRVQKKYWLGWFTPFWYIWETGFEACTEEWRDRNYLSRHLKEKGSKTKRVKRVVEVFE